MKIFLQVLFFFCVNNICQGDHSYYFAQLVCKCTGDRNCNRTTNTCEVYGKCYAETWRKEHGIVTEYGCFQEEDLTPKGNPFQCHTSIKNIHFNTLTCCHDSNMCNAKPENHPTLAPPPPEAASLTKPYAKEISITVSVVLLGLVLLVLVLLMVKKVSNDRQNDKKNNINAEENRPANRDNNNNNNNNMNNNKINNNNNRGYCVKMDSDILRSDEMRPLAGSTECTNVKYDLSKSSCSGAGIPLCNLRTISEQVKLEEVVGTGKYGEVWRGVWLGDNVAVKIFHSREESSWLRESQIYQTTMLRHEFILGFIASDNKDIGTWTQLWLVTDYHPHGSLFDYLGSHTVTIKSALSMMFSLASGLAHLHNAIPGTQGKPGIAHRDLKSKNVLVKNNLTCCIADLGLAVKQEANSSLVDIAVNNNRIGTKRYMAPEILTNSIDFSSFQSFMQADVYSMSLCFWEIMRRCQDCNPTTLGYQLPYFDSVPSDPTLEEMTKVVVTMGIRPSIEPQWVKDKMANSVRNIMEECWMLSGPSRRTSFKVKKDLYALMHQGDPVINNEENHNLINHNNIINNNNNKNNNNNFDVCFHSNDIIDKSKTNNSYVKANNDMFSHQHCPTNSSMV